MPDQSLQPLKVVLIGSGNVATHLGTALKAAGSEITTVHSRNAASAKLLAKKLGAKATTSLSRIGKSPSFIVIAVKDDAIASVVKALNVKESIVVHTSGTTPMSVLKKFPQYGVFYPLQTFSKSLEPDFSDIPVCIEAGDTSTLLSLSTIAETISESVYNLDSAQRERVHLAAVFANNFTNHLYAVAEDLLNEEGLPFDLLRPLISETALKVLDHSPAEAQTGPAVRNDRKVMQRHLSLLGKRPDLQLMYKEFSAAIQKRAKKKK
jgi:predicted short-subunit dehydrogenase-like oxidoreductase (DUF2520 family)